MPLSLASIIQQNSGTFVGTSGSATLPVATTAGNTVILIISQNLGLVTPAGFSVDTNNGLSTLKGGIYRKSNVGAESSWTIAPSTTSICCWTVFEVEGLDLSNPLDTKQAGAMATGTGSSLSTGLTAIASSFDVLVFAMHAALDTTSPTPGTWSAHTGGVAELVDQGGDNGTISVGLSVSAATSLSLAAWASTATKTVAAGQAALAGVVVYTAAGAKNAADLTMCTGFEFGTSTGLTLGPATVAAGGPIFDGSAGTPAVVTTSPRSGAYCLELSAAAAIENLSWTSVTIGSAGTQICSRFSIYLPSLPGTDVELFAAVPLTAAQSTIIRFKSATGKLSIQVGTGTEVLSDAVVTAGQWMSVDFRVDARTTTYLADWKIQYADDGAWVDQAQASMAGATALASHGIRIGWVASTTATVRYDDIVVSIRGGHFPLGDYKILPIKIDPALPCTLSGTSTNFNTFTANGSLAAWDGTVAHNNIDELPPVLGASADGFAQIATAVSDYVEIPMETVDAASMGAAIRGVRALACGWASTGVAATLGMRAWDGVQEMNIVAAGAVDRQFDNTTGTSWMCAMVKAQGANPRNDWTQAKLDALALRVGFSGDADPDIGIHAVYGEVALRIGDIIRITSSDEGFYLDERYDPDSSGIISFIITTPPDRGAHFTWSILGVPEPEIYVPADTVHEEIIGATDIATVTELTLTPDPS